MNDDKIVKDSARDPGRESLGPLRSGIRAAAKKAVRKVVKKSGRKKAAKKTSAAAKTTARGARPAKREDKPAPADVDAPASRGSAARTSARRDSTASSGTTQAASGTARASDAASPLEPGSSVETPRPPGPIHPGAALDSVQEHAGGLGGLLALWGPLIIVGFLVLVFRGGDDSESTVASVAAVAEQARTDAESEVARRSHTRDHLDPDAGGIGRPLASAPSAVAQDAGEAFDGGFAMRTSMAGPSAYGGRSPGAGMPPVAPLRHYPSPPGPYSDPRFRSLPTGESWSADGAREWMWSAEGPAGPRPESGGDASLQWVRCAPPYYWCPAPSSPAW